MSKQKFFRGATLFLFSLLCTLSSYAQSTVQGTMRDEVGEPLIRTTTQVKGEQGGTVTDIDGNYRLTNVRESAILVFTYVDCATQEVAAKGQTQINVTMETDRRDFDEIIVVGYAVGTRRNVSGAIDRVGEKGINKGVATDITDALKGKVSGVVISSIGGDPMGTANVRIRGTSFLSGGNDPLVIIDGIFSDMTMFNTLQPSDIESITILEDASETAQYGSRDTAGIIVVATKQSKSGSSNISYNGTIGINPVSKNIEMPDASAYRNLAKGRNLTSTDMKANTNWLDAVECLTGITQDHHVSFSSGNDKGNYRANLGYIQRQGAARGSGMENYTTKLDVTQLGFDRKLKLELGLRVGERKGKQQYDMYRTFYSAAAYNPTYPTSKSKQDTWDEDYLANEVYGPSGQLEILNKYSASNQNVHGKTTWTLLDGLFLSAFGSYTKLSIEHQRHLPNNIKRGVDNGSGWAYLKNVRRQDTMGNIRLTYKKDFDAHHIDALALVGGQSYKTFWNSSEARGFETNYFGVNNMKAGANVSQGDNQNESKEYMLNSYMARINYMYANRYITTANVCADSSSKFGSRHKWGWLPSASLAQVLSEEDFIKQAKWTNNLKLRAGYGVAGNQDAIDPYNSLALYKPNGVTPYNGANTTISTIQSNDNPDLKWEVKHAFDVGLNFAAFDSRLKLTLDWYTSRIKDLLYTHTVPVPPFAYNTLLANMSEMTNNGFEIGLRGDIVRTKDFTFNSGLNLFFQKNKLNSLSRTYEGQELTASEHIVVADVRSVGLTQNTGVTYLIEGEPIGTFYIPHCIGISKTGQYELEDIVKDGEIDTGDAGDRRVAGQAIPKAYPGWDFTLSYKNWDLTMQFSGASGHKIYDGTSMAYSNMNNFPTYNILANAPEKNIHDIQISNYWLEKGDYVNFEYINLGYTFTKKQLKMSWIQSLYPGLAVNNVCTFTGYSGLTSMINSALLGYIDEGTGTAGTLGIDNKRIYPLVRTFSFNVSVNF